MRTRDSLAKPIRPAVAPAAKGRPIVAGDARFLAFTFAAADLVVEFDEDWRVLYGMSRTENGPEHIRAKTLSDVVDPASIEKVTPLQSKLGPNARSKPVPVMLKTAAGPRHAVMRAFRARDLGTRLSCIFTFQDEAAAIETVNTPAPAREAASAVLSTDDLLARAARVLQNPRAILGRLYFTFVELTGLMQTAGRPVSPAAEKALRDLESLLKLNSVGGASAGKIRNGRYVLLTDQSTSLEGLVKAMDSLGPDVAALLVPRTSQAAVADPGSPLTSLRALRFAIDRFFAKESNPDVATLAAELSTTLKDAGDFRMAIQDRKFKLAYQPIVRLSDEKTVGFEALLRLPGSGNTAASVRMAEQLGLIDAVDVAVAEAAWSVIEHDRSRELAIAINISGRALRDDGYIQGLINMTRRSQSMRNRFTIEITESAALEDLEAADRRVQNLRRMGFRVCVDDFGAGAASFDYLRALNIDSIKIDGRYVREVAVSDRARTLVQHFVRLCSVLKIETMGARTENRAAAEALKGLGVDYAQGWYYGRPMDEPHTIDPAVAARRKGEQTEWR
jgi:EAL domain-containing protein (putative c-di-GMP-specific phosphodiesterase class I)